MGYSTNVAIEPCCLSTCTLACSLHTSHLPCLPCLSLQPCPRLCSRFNSLLPPSSLPPPSHPPARCLKRHTLPQTQPPSVALQQCPPERSEGAPPPPPPLTQPLAAAPVGDRQAMNDMEGLHMWQGMEDQKVTRVCHAGLNTKLGGDNVDTEGMATGAYIY